MSRAAVCIPVAKDPEGLSATLDALAKSGIGTDEPLVVVVVDGGDEATADVARRHGAICLTWPERKGSYAARNAAIASLPDDVDVVVFTDAGCLPQPGWIAAHIDALQRTPQSGGAVEITVTSRLTPAEWVDSNRNLRQQAYVENDGFAATCNLAVRREVLHAVRFDDRLMSGGDRDFGVRARAAGFGLVYTPDAVVQHPARASSREVLAKARRVGAGIAAMPRATRPGRLPNRRPGLNLVRQARWAQLGRSPWWLLRVAWLDNKRARTLHDAATRPQPLRRHVVVLLASDWDALEHFSTRWREIIVEWSKRPDIDLLTVVDHPDLRRRALVERRLLDSRPGWLDGVQRQHLVIPVDGRRRRTDGLGWRRAARQLRAGWPPARSRVVVAATPVCAPLLRHLRDEVTVTGFDSVDPWSVRDRFAHLADRVGDGYRHAVDADVVTATGRNVADDLVRLGARDVQVVANGADLAAFRAPAPPPPVDLPKTAFALYVGNTGGRIDLDLLENTASVLTDVPVVIAGPAADAATEARLRAGPAHWVGPVAAADVPGLVQAAACGLVPFRDVGLGEVSDSMKVMQYLAAGLPVVSTDVAGVLPGIRVAASPEEFAAQVRKAVSEPAQGAAMTPAVDVASWKDVADQLLALYFGGSDA